MFRSVERARAKITRLAAARRSTLKTRWVHLAAPLCDVRRGQGDDYRGIRHYNETRPHSSLGYLTPAAWRERLAQLTA
jgi:transposase InsO family protein